jgi:hypothetical protein
MVALATFTRSLRRPDQDAKATLSATHSVALFAITKSPRSAITGPSQLTSRLLCRTKALIWLSVLDAQYSVLGAQTERVDRIGLQRLYCR